MKLLKNVLNKRYFWWSIRIILLFVLFGWDIILSPYSKTNSLDEITAAEVSGIAQITNELSDFKEMHKFERKLKYFMRKWEVEGAAIGIVKDNKFVYAKGLGYADAEQKIEVQPDNLFRLASISKLLTATAIMQLYENGKLSLNDTVFGENGILNDSFFLDIRDEKVKQITVKNLMDHTGGWSLRGGDPMFMPRVIARIMNQDLPVDENDITRFVLKYRRLRWKPGTRSCYSNYGYVALGMVIERVSGMDYEAYVKRNILNPLGINNMYIGYALPENMHPKEVKYYVPSNMPSVLPYFNDTSMVSKQYGGNDIRTLGAAGGWVGSVIDLMKIVTALDGFDGRTDILTKESIDIMINNENGSLGWKGANQSMWWRTGSLAGTSAMIVRQNDGLEWIMLLNTSTWKGSDFTKYIFHYMNQALNQVESLPDNDLFLYNSVYSLYN